MYKGVKISIKTIEADIGDFPIDIWFHQGFALNLFLLTIVVDKLIKGIQDEILWCTLFADDIVLTDETKEDLSTN